MVDYSKWDHLEDSSEEEQETRGRHPRVTHFDTPRSIILGKVDYSEAAGEENEHKETAEETTSARSRDAADAAAPVSQERKATMTDATDSVPLRDTETQGGLDTSLSIFPILDYALITRNGQATQRYCWSQTRESLVLHVVVPLQVKGKHVSITFPTPDDQPSLSFSPPHTNLSSSLSSDDDRQQLQSSERAGSMAACWPQHLMGGKAVGYQIVIRIRGLRSETDLSHSEIPLLHETFRYPVQTDDDSVFWELKTFSRVSSLPTSPVSDPPVSPMWDPLCINSSIPSGSCTRSASTATVSPPLSSLSLASRPVRFLILTLRKFNLLQGATIWWDRLFHTECPIENLMTGLPDRPPSTTSFKQSWEEAHRLFVERRKQKGENGEDTRIPL